MGLRRKYMNEEHSKLLTIAKLKRISSYVDEMLAIVSAKESCDYNILDNVNAINNNVVYLYDYIITMPVESEESEEEAIELSETEDSQPLEVQIKEE
jgi:hypothetical protein